MVINIVEVEYLVSHVSTKLYFYEHSLPSIRWRCEGPPSQAWSLSLISKHSVPPVPILPNMWVVCALTEGSLYLVHTGKLVECVLTQLCHKVGSRAERDQSFGPGGLGVWLGTGPWPLPSGLPATILFLPQCGLFAAAVVIYILAFKFFCELLHCNENEI